MLLIYLKTPGILFKHPIKSKTYRTPIKFQIEDKDRELVESLIKTTAIIDYEIYEFDCKIEKNYKVPKLSLISPSNSVNINYKIKN